MKLNKSLTFDKLNILLFSSISRKRPSTIYVKILNSIKECNFILCLSYICRLWRMILLHDFHNILSKEWEIFSNKERCMTKSVLVIEYQSFQLSLNPFSVNVVSSLIFVSNKHGDWNFINLRYINNRWLFLTIFLHINSTTIVISLKLLGIDDLSVMI